MFSEPDFNKKQNEIKDDFKKLVNQMLDKNQKTRITISDVKKSIYFTNFDFDMLIQKKMKNPRNLDIDFKISNLSPNNNYDDTIDSSISL